MEAMPEMPGLKRKREDVDEGKPDDDEAAAAGTDTTDVAPARVVHPSSSLDSSPSSPQSAPPAPAPALPAPCSTVQEGDVETHGDGAADSTSVNSVKADKRTTAKKVAVAERQTILICGKETVLKSTGGRKRRKHPMETLVILAYKARLALECKANDMVAALEIYDEMREKGIKRDLSTHLLVLSLCGGSPGEKDELDPGNGSTNTTAATAATVEKEAAASDLEKDADGSGSAAVRDAQPGSAQENVSAAAEAALQIFAEASKDGTVCLPEAAYTSVIRACCLDGRADRAREVLGNLKRAGGKTRVRTYAPLLEAYAGLDGRLEDCLAVWRDAVSPPTGVQMTEREYLHLIAACTRARDEKRFLEVMAEYMDDVLQPRSRHSWDVLKAWFEVAGGVTESTTTTTTAATTNTAAAATTAVTEPETAPATATVTATATATVTNADAATATATDSTTTKCEVAADERMPDAFNSTAKKCEDGDEDMTPNAGDSSTTTKCEVDGDERMPDAADVSTTTKCEGDDDDEDMTPVPPRKGHDDNGDDGDNDGDDDGAEKRLRETQEENGSTAAAAEPPNTASEKDAGAVVAAPAAGVMEDAADATPTTTATTSNAEERTRETASTAAAVAVEPPSAPEQDGAEVAVPAAAAEPPNTLEKDGGAVAAAPVDAEGAMSPTTTATVSRSVTDGGGDGDVASPARPPSPSEGSKSDAACKAQRNSGSVFGKWVVSECKVGDDGTCENCGEVLRSIELSEDDEERLLKQIQVLACTNEQRTKQWEGFTSWIERRGKDRFNVIIDGANVGYFKKNAAAAGELADLIQVDWAVKKYEDEGKKPLVVLHSRHLVEKRLSDEAKAVLKRWKEAGLLQTCAPKNNDDWYWLHAAVYTGGKVLVLTNDEMRDHHFSMLSHRSFERWKERHQARFYFGDWEGDVREVITDEPRSYSKRTQKGEHSFHLPLRGSSDWLCATRQPLKGAINNTPSSSSQPQPAEQPVLPVDGGDLVAEKNLSASSSSSSSSSSSQPAEPPPPPVDGGGLGAAEAMDVSNSGSKPAGPSVPPVDCEAALAEVAIELAETKEQPTLPVDSGAAGAEKASGQAESEQQPAR